MPKQFGAYFFGHSFNHNSAPTSPTRAIARNNTSLHREENDNSRPASVDANSDDCFEFDFSGQRLPPEPTTADNLFQDGRIRTLEDPPASINPSGLSTPHRRGRSVAGELHPFSTRMIKATTNHRGREMRHFSSTSRKGSRSLSPVREILDPISSPASPLKKVGQKWRLIRNLLLFRSKSEGSATSNMSKDSLCKETIFPPSLSLSSSSSSSSSPTQTNKRGDREEPRRRSIATADGKGKGATASAHEKHYTANRAAWEELKKKTLLPYRRQGLFSYMGQNSTIKGISRRTSHSRTFNLRASKGGTEN